MEIEIDEHLKAAILAKADDLDRMYREIEAIEDRASKRIEDLSARLASEGGVLEDIQQAFRKEAAIILEEAKADMQKLNPAQQAG